MIKHECPRHFVPADSERPRVHKHHAAQDIRGTNDSASLRRHRPALAGAQPPGSQGSGGTSDMGTGGTRTGSGGSLGSGGSSTAVGTGQGGTGASGGALGNGGALGTGGMLGNGGMLGIGGSSSSGGGEDSCSNVTPCGGDTVGTWTVTSSCLTVSGEQNLVTLGVGCTSAQGTGSAQVTGDWTGSSDGTYSDKTTTSGTEQLTLPASCLHVAGTVLTCERSTSNESPLRYDSISCRSTAGVCACSIVAKQAGWPGYLSTSSSISGTYTTSGTTITLDDEASYSYCVSGNQMIWTPLSRYQRITGTMVFQRAGGG
jgi:hypothetical protein